LDFKLTPYHLVKLLGDAERQQWQERYSNVGNPPNNRPQNPSQMTRRGQLCGVNYFSRPAR
jgi:hypothetical protein